MKSEELQALHQTYREAVEVARDESASKEARETAQGAVIDLRHAMDAALVEDKAEREDEKRAELVEARASSAREAAQIVTPAKSAVPVEEIRAYGQRTHRGETMSFTVPFSPQETRADWTTTDTDTYSSYTVPETWVSDVYKFQLAQSGVLQAGPTMLNTANGNQINYPKLVTDMSSATGAEGVAATETNPVFGTVPLNSYRVDGFTPVADELFRDAGVNVEALIRDLAGRSLAIKSAPYYSDIDIGTGSTLPAAITAGLTSALTGGVGVTAVTLDQLRTLYAAVLPQYRMNGTWVVNSAVYLSLLLEKDTTNQYLFQPSQSADIPDRFMGKPIIEDAYMDASAAGNIPVIFGDVRAAYLVRRIGGVEVSLSRDFAFTSFETTARFALWHDAATIDAIAVKGITLGAAS